ncbi:hypothetical protein CsSME_00024932 [Camellia sinensis var. sinensis]
MAVPLDDCDFILGNDFFVAAKVALMPYLDGLLISDEKEPCFVAKKDEMLLAMQVRNGLRKGEETFLVALIEIKLALIIEVSDAVTDVLAEFVDVMPPELPKSLPPRRATNHKIKLVLGAKASAKALY